MNVPFVMYLFLKLCTGGKVRPPSGGRVWQHRHLRDAPGQERLRQQQDQGRLDPPALCLPEGLQPDGQDPHHEAQRGRRLDEHGQRRQLHRLLCQGRVFKD